MVLVERVPVVVHGDRAHRALLVQLVSLIVIVAVGIIATPLFPAPVCVGHAEGGPGVVGGGALAPVGVRHRRVAVVAPIVIVVGRRSL